MLCTSSILPYAASQLALDYCAHRQALAEELFTKTAVVASHDTGVNKTRCVGMQAV